MKAILTRSFKGARLTKIFLISSLVGVVRRLACKWMINLGKLEGDKDREVMPEVFSICDCSIFSISDGSRVQERLGFWSCTILFLRLLLGAIVWRNLVFLSPNEIH